jgi:hypothetical protein
MGIMSVIKVNFTLLNKYYRSVTKEEKAYADF